MNNKNQSMINRTGQTWKYITAQTAGLIGISVFAGAFYFFPTQSRQFELCLAASGVFFIVDLILTLGIKCPECKTRWFLLALKSPASSKGLSKFRTQEECPACGFSGDSDT